MSAALSIDRLTVRFGGLTAVDDVSLRIQPGALVGLIGANGAGKTSLLRACAGLLKPDAGTVAVAGKPVADWPRDKLARHVGYLAQDRAVHWPVSVRRLAELGRLPHLGPWDSPAVADRAAVDAALAQADVVHLADRSVTTLSGGERTRALIARLLAGAPDIMLADEPVSGLDPAHRIQVLEFFRGIAAGGRTVVVVLHDLTLAARFCDRLVLMHGGKVAADGAPRDVLTPGLLASAYGVGAAFLEHEGQMVVVPWATTR